MAGKSWCRMLLVVVAALFVWTSAPVMAAGSCGGPKNKEECTKKAGCFWNGKACAVKSGGGTAKAPAKANGKTAAVPSKGAGKGAGKATASKAGKGAGKAAAKPATAAAKKPVEPAKPAEPAAAATTEPADSGDMPAGEEDGATEDATEDGGDF